MERTNIDPFTKAIYENNFKVFESPVLRRRRSMGQSAKALQTQEDKEDGPGDSLFFNMRGFLIFGRVLGIIPISGVMDRSQNGFKFGMKTTPAIMSTIITFMVGFSAILSLIFTLHQPKSNALQIAQSIHGCVFRLWVLFNYSYFLTRAGSLINIFKTWGNSILIYPSKDSTLKRDIIIITSFVFSLGILECILIHLEYFPQFDFISLYSTTDGKSTLQTYYNRSHPDWDVSLGYNPFLAVMAFITQKFVLFGWIYVDTLIILFARALYFKFKSLCEISGEKLEKANDPPTTVTCGLEERLCWINIVKDHDTLCNLLESFEAFLSPLVFGSFSTNIYYICMQTIEGLLPTKVENSVIHSIFSPLSFLSISSRIFLLSNMAARINTFAHEIRFALKKCPIELYEAEIARVDKHVTSGPDIGLTGLGCFTVTKPFLLSIINVVFTVEIVLLQGITTPTSGTCAVK